MPLNSQPCCYEGITASSTNTLCVYNLKQKRTDPVKQNLPDIGKTESVSRGCNLSQRCALSTHKFSFIFCGYKCTVYTKHDGTDTHLCTFYRHFLINFIFVREKDRVYPHFARFRSNFEQSSAASLTAHWGAVSTWCSKSRNGARVYYSTGCDGTRIA